MEQKTTRRGNRKETIEEFMSKEKSKKCVELINRGYTMRRIYETTGISYSVSQKVRNELARQEHLKRMNEIGEMYVQMSQRTNPYEIIESKKPSNIFKRLFSFFK